MNYPSFRRINLKSIHVVHSGVKDLSVRVSPMSEENINRKFDVYALPAS
jgi:hypothetical protein